MNGPLAKTAFRPTFDCPQVVGGARSAELILIHSTGTKSLYRQDYFLPQLAALWLGSGDEMPHRPHPLKAG